MRYIVGCIVTLMSAMSTFQHPLAVQPPILGAWQLVGTTPPGFVRQGVQVARVTLTMSGGHLHGLVLTGSHRYTAPAQYAASHRELRLTIHTVKGIVRLQATLWKDGKRMIGTWYDTRGDDGGFVLVRLK